MPPGYSKNRWYKAIFIKSGSTVDHQKAGNWDEEGFTYVRKAPSGIVAVFGNNRYHQSYITAEHAKEFLRIEAVTSPELNQEISSNLHDVMFAH